MAEHPRRGNLTTIALWVCVALIVCSITAGVAVLGVIFTDLAAFRLVVAQHFIAVLGLPAAAAAAFIIVTLFRQGEEPIKIRGLGFEIHGPAGQVVLWVLCFLALCGGIKLLW